MYDWVGDSLVIVNNGSEVPDCLKHVTVNDYEIDYSRCLLLDPSATEELSENDKENFDFLLFGGILVVSLIKG